jgi:hypothetical protein
MVGIHIQFTGTSSLLDSSDYTLKDQEEIYDAMLLDLMENTRWYLDNYEYLREFRVSWVDYKTQKITKPYRFVHPEKHQNAKKSESFINKTTPIYSIDSETINF